MTAAGHCSGNMKAMPRSGSANGNWCANIPAPWELYDMEADRTEMHDLAAQHPQRVQEMIVQYDAWAKRCGVIPREKILELMKAEGGTAFWEEEKQT